METDCTLESMHRGLLNPTEKGRARSTLAAKRGRQAGQQASQSEAELRQLRIWLGHLLFLKKAIKVYVMKTGNSHALKSGHTQHH